MNPKKSLRDELKIFNSFMTSINSRNGENGLRFFFYFLRNFFLGFFSRTWAELGGKKKETRPGK